MQAWKRPDQQENFRERGEGKEAPPGEPEPKIAHVMIAAEEEE
jgi:hypothetical protein